MTESGARPESTASVAVDHASLAYGRRRVLDDVCVSVSQGERLAVIGPSGAGKTTLFRLIAGLVKPDEGRVMTLGHDTTTLAGKRLRHLRREVGFLHQQDNLIPQLRVVHNVLMGRLGYWRLPKALSSLLWPQQINLATAALDRVELADRLWSLPDELSGGQQQRVAVARLIVQQPQLILADEPVSALDLRLGLTLTADLASNHVRKTLRGDSNTPSRTPLSSSTTRVTTRPPLHAWYAVMFVTVILIWSLWFMGWGNRAGDDGQPRNHLAPAAELITGEAWGNLNFFRRLLSPELDLAAIGLGDTEAIAKREAAGTTVDLFAHHGPGDFWRPSAWAGWLNELRQWFVWRVLESAAVPLAIAVVGTMLGVAGTLLLTYPHSTTFQWLSERFTGETRSPFRRAWRGAQLVAARAVAVISRGVPEVMWAFLFIAFFGPGLVAGTLAIAVHTLGVARLDDLRLLPVRK